MSAVDEFETDEKNVAISESEAETAEQASESKAEEAEQTSESEAEEEVTTSESEAETAEQASESEAETAEQTSESEAEIAEASSESEETKVVGKKRSTEEFESELKRVRYRYRYEQVLRSTIYLLLVAAAIAILVVTLWMPVIEIYGKSMTPTLVNGEIVVLVKTSKYKTGDIIAFYYNNKILVKRVIAQSGDWIDITKDGDVVVNGKKIDEPYVSEKSLGECDIKLPYQVPDERVFVMGDHRSVSVDSRSSQIGCIADEQVVGRITFRVWPFKRLGNI
jgi:signal peptidase I